MILRSTALKSRAEQSYAEKSFSRAHDLYEQAEKAASGATEKRWTAMRLADTAWRAAAASPSADSSVRDTARTALETLIRDSGDEHDRAWAEAQESLGDFFAWQQGASGGTAVEHYQDALEWWAGSPDLSLARRRYLDIVYRMAESPQNRYMQQNGVNVYGISREVLANAVAIAETPEDQAHTQFLFATKLLQEGQPQSVERALELLDGIIARGRATKWYADALMAAAERVSQGVPVVSDNGAITWKSDYTRALGLYRKLLADFRRDETAHYDRATSFAREITAPAVQAMVSSTFLPGSEEEISLSWRNVKEVSFTVTPVDLIDDAVPNNNSVPGMTEFRTHERPVRQWTFSTNDKGDYTPGQQMIRIAPKLEAGAYVIEASSGTTSSKQRLLVTDANVLVHSSGGRADLFVCSAVTGEPIPDARVRVWIQKQQGSAEVRDVRGDAKGFASVKFDTSSGAIVVAASAAANRQATVTTWSYNYRNPSAPWRIYAFTDRPAYRPDETVHWKIIGRTRPDNEWVTPAREAIDYDIVSPRGEKVSSGTANLNEFGSFWADLPLTSSMPLGTYRIEFRSRTDRNAGIGCGNAVPARGVQASGVPRRREDRRGKGAEEGLPER